MPVCPTCGTTSADPGTKCSVCGAPLVPRDSSTPTLLSRPTVAQGFSWKYLLVKLVFTALIAFGLFGATALSIIMTGLSLPIGLANSPVKGWVLLGFLYLPIGTIAIACCWRKSPLHPLVLLAVAPPLLVVLLGLLS